VEELSPDRSLYFRLECYMEQITSRKNHIITQLRALGTDTAARRAAGEFLCDGEKALNEALTAGAEVTRILWAGEPKQKLPETAEQYCCPLDLLQYVSPLKNSPGPVFSVKIPKRAEKRVQNAIVLENVQDPGNVGTVIRTANAMGVGAVVLASACADLWNPKTVRATMGAIFRQNVVETDLVGLKDYVNQNELKLYGAALSDRAADIREVNVKNAAVAVGSEGGGLSDALLSICEGEVIIPMEPCAESLNAAVAASIVLWEMRR